MTADPTPPIEGMTVAPFGLPLMGDAWSACMSWAIGVPEIRAQFKADTGRDIESVANARGIAKAIDEATGHSRAVMLAWLDWATVNVWGNGEEPASPYVSEQDGKESP